MDKRTIANLNKIWLAEWYYIPAVLLYVLNMFCEYVRPGAFATVLMLIVVAELIIKRDMRLSEFTDKLVAAYFLYNTLSVIWLLRGGLPVSVYTKEFIVSLLPVIFYYVGIKGKSEGFYKNFIIAILIIGVLGIILQIFTPTFYIDYSYKLSFISKADAATTKVRMDSVVGSTVLGFISVAAMLTSIPFIMKKQSRVFGIVAMLINVLVAFLSNQRSAMVVAILVIVYFNYLLFFEFDVIDKKYFGVEIAVLAVLFVALCFVKMDAVLKIYYRLVSLPEAVGEKSEQWIAAVNNMYSTWLGNGLGANGHRALYIEGTHVIADGGLVKMYCEQGIFGFSIFIYLMILTLKKGILNVQSHYVELGIIFIALLSSVGSNILAFQLTCPIFWYAVGMVNAKNGD